jgi:hypothetical protein
MYTTDIYVDQTDILNEGKSKINLDIHQSQLEPVGYDPDPFLWTGSGSESKNFTANVLWLGVRVNYNLVIISGVVRDDLG